jgi:hypothetical protein
MTMRRQVLGVVLLLAAFWAYSWQWALAEEWVRYSGGVTPEGTWETSSRSFVNRPFETVAVLGKRWVSPSLSQATTAFAAVVHFDGDRAELVSSPGAANPVRVTIQYRWMVYHDRPDGSSGDQVGFTATYDALANTVRIDGSVYRLKRGNVFDVRIDGARTVHVRQVNTVWTGDQPGGPVIDALEGSRPGRPCPPPAAAPPAAPPGGKRV